MLLRLSSLHNSDNHCINYILALNSDLIIYRLLSLICLLRFALRWSKDTAHICILEIASDF